MASFTNRYPLNVPGKFYVDDQCTDCDLCRECAPANIRRDDRTGQSYVYKQPENEAEVTLIMEGVYGCPTYAVGDDGHQFHWATTPMIDWNSTSGLFNREKLAFQVSCPVIPYEMTIQEKEQILILHRIRALEPSKKASIWRRFLSAFKKST